MCGIAGILSSNISTDLLEAKGRAMMTALIHRGPDDGGLWMCKPSNLVLVHRRLAIQDISDKGKQPMFSSSKRYCIVFNGEIYNFKEIAVELTKLGHQFCGHSDTEVLLAAVSEWGLTRAVNRFVGMFAFALWDNEENVLHLCRDRMGEKPLYYGWIGKSFIFASELKAIERVTSKDKLEIDKNALAGFLRYGYINAPYSIYHGIYKLIPGTILSMPTHIGIDQANYSPWPDCTLNSPATYWSVIDTANQGLSNLILDENEAVDELDRLLRRTIKRQMIADVNIGTFLSGGIDSSVVSAIAQQETRERVRTYTIGFSEKEYDESEYAENIARHLGTEHLSMYVTPQDVLQVVPNLPTIYDEPFADSSQIPAYLVSRMAREHVTVCLSGDGGDELFAGYNRYLWTEYIWSKLSNIPWPLKRLIGKALAAPSPRLWDSLYHTFTAFHNKSQQTSQKLIGLKLQKLAGLMQYRDINDGYDYLLSYWVRPESLMTENASDQHHAPDRSYPDTIEFINRAMYLDQIAYLPGDNLAKVDRASMAVSLETRLPLLSHEVVDLSWRLPVSMKVQNKTAKWALRQVLYKYVPKNLIDRPKMGFSVPIEQWLRGELKEWAEDLLDTIDTNSGGMLLERPIRKVWNEHISGRRDHSHRLWTLLMFLSWAHSRT